MTDSVALRTPVKNASINDRMGLLHKLAFTAGRIVSGQLDGFTTRLVDALTARAEDTVDSDEIRHAARHLGSHRTTFHRIVNECLQQSLLQAVQHTGEQGMSRLRNGAMDLSRNTFEAMQKKVLIDNLAQALDGTEPELLAVLGTRIACWLDPAQPPTAPGPAIYNPFRAEVFLEAMSDAWQKFDANGTAPNCVLQAMRPDVFFPLGQVWQALNQELVAQNILPDAEEIHRGRQARPASPPAPGMKHRLQQWLAPIGKINMIDVRALELLEKLFELVLRVEAIPEAAKTLLLGLREPLRKAALADTEFFFDSSHPARLLSEVAITAALACVAESSADPVLQALEQAVRRAGEISDNPGLALAEIANDLQATLAREERKFGVRLAEAVAKATSEEDMAHARQLANENIAVCIESGEVPAFIEHFLQTQWIRAVTFAYQMQAEKPDLVPNVLSAMDELVWSVQPKAGAEARKELIKRLPPLLSILNVWLNVVKWEGMEREAFFTELANTHAAAIRTPDEMKPRDHLALRMDKVQKASEHLLTRRGKEQQIEALSPFLQEVDTLVPGRWVDFVRNNGTRVNCRLAWVSPGRSRFVFIGRPGELVFALTDESLAQALRAKRAGIIAADKLIERALADALNELGST